VAFGPGTFVITATSGAAVANGNQIGFDLTKLAAITVAASDLITPGGQFQFLQVSEVVSFLNSGRDDTIYVGAGYYPLDTQLGQPIGSFTVSVNASGTFAITATTGAAVATTPTRVDIEPCALNMVRITPNPGVSWYIDGVVGRSGISDVVALGDATYTLGLINPLGSLMLTTFSVSAASGLSATQLPQGSPLVTLALVSCAPVVGPITAPLTPVPVNTAIAASASFTDANALETHTAVWKLGRRQPRSMCWRSNWRATTWRFARRQGSVRMLAFTMFTHAG
jgi:hypothetical protein